MSVGKSLSYQFDDKDWFKKLGLGALISLVPVLSFAWIGYTVELIRNIKGGDATPLPVWSGLGKKWVSGLMLVLARLIYGLPAIIVVIIPAIFIVPAMLVNNQDVQSVLGSVAGIVGIPLLCLWVVYLLAYTFFQPAILITYAKGGTFRSAFAFREIFKMVFANIGEYLLAWLVTFGISLAVGAVMGIAGTVLGFVPFLGILLEYAAGALAGTWLSSSIAHLFALVGMNMPEMGELPSPPRPVKAPSPQETINLSAEPKPAAKPAPKKNSG